MIIEKKLIQKILDKVFSSLSAINDQETNSAFLNLDKDQGSSSANSKKHKDKELQYIKPSKIE